MGVRCFSSDTILLRCDATTHMCACVFSNIVRRRPLNNRTPTPEEMELYLPILLEEIRLVDPDIIVTLGSAAWGVAAVTARSYCACFCRWRNK